MSFVMLTQFAAMPAVVLASLAVVPAAAAVVDWLGEEGRSLPSPYDDMDPSYLLYCHAMF